MLKPPPTPPVPLPKRDVLPDYLHPCVVAMPRHQSFLNAINARQEQPPPEKVSARKSATQIERRCTRGEQLQRVAGDDVLLVSEDHRLTPARRSPFSKSTEKTCLA